MNEDTSEENTSDATTQKDGEVSQTVTPYRAPEVDPVESTDDFDSLSDDESSGLLSPSASASRPLVTKVLMVVGAVLFLAIVAGQAYLILTPDPNDVEPETFTSLQKGFSLTQPGLSPALTGTRDSSQAEVLFFMSDVDNSAAIVQVADVNLEDVDVGEAGDEITAEAAKTLLEFYAREGTEIPEGTPTTLGGNQAFKFTYTVQQAAGARVYTSIVARNGDKVYTLTLSVPEGVKAELAHKNFEAMADSFKFTS